MRLPFRGSLNEPRFSNAVAPQKRMTYNKGRRKKNEAVTHGNQFTVPLCGEHGC